MKTSSYARTVANALNRSACGEITRWLRENAEHADLVTEYERQCLLNAAGALEEIIKWQGD